MSRHALVDGDGNVVNVVVWDGVEPWTPPDGAETVELPDGVPAEPGGRREPGGKPEWVRAPREEQP